MWVRGGAIPDVEAWLLSCALHAHPAEELLFADLLRLPELLPFQLQLGLEQVRRVAPVAVQRQGLNRIASVSGSSDTS